MSLARGLAAACLVGIVATDPGGVTAGPVEAREAWEQARTLVGRPWPERARALRRVRTLTFARDPLVTRSLAAEASLLRSVARVHAAAALEARAAALVPSHDPDRALRRAVQARSLLDEEDRAAARPPWEEAARLARSEMPWRADEALEALGQLDAEEGDAPGLARRIAQAEAEGARPSTRIRLWGAAGLLAWKARDLPAAHRALAQAERAFQQAGRAEPREAGRAAKDWLDLELRRRLRPG
jgi:hypothetical protein